VTAESVQIPSELISKPNVSEDGNPFDYFHSSSQGTFYGDKTLTELDKLLVELFAGTLITIPIPDSLGSYFSPKNFVEQHILPELKQSQGVAVVHKEETPHPFKGNNVSKEIAILGARRLYLYFSKRTKLHSIIEIQERETHRRLVRYNQNTGTNVTIYL
jgi:hypothetical protein